VIWNDMPEGNQNHEAAMIRDGHLDVDTFLRLFALTGTENDLVEMSHYGCLQGWHSMAPIVRTQLKLHADDANRIVFTNQDVKDFIIGQGRIWWDHAVRNLANKDHYSWYLGHLMHMLEDSYPKGHTVRDSSATACGNVVMFQGYDAQHGNEAHKAADFTPASPKHVATDVSLAKRVECAQNAAKTVFELFSACVTANSAAHASCQHTVLDPLFASVYTFHTVQGYSAGSSKAGGSDPNFIKTTHTDFDTIRVPLSGSGLTVVTDMFVPKSNKMWSSVASGTTICSGKKAIQSKCASGVGVYIEHDFETTQYFDMRHA